ncbi:GAF domain-containing protein [Mucilaginibacter frigoritolerans]|uniref:GAF domain-containing protein n=1 Tax=Mucilaginibacter frigoritolerans TaxID=652788 RepID=A0A562TQE8_9SPHI|nr:GAF domain-containing protein [Mucilaginibacter frigoritolerans]TWI95336.1 GAF domain-containing protein [Mucilaginibacter frigoritolerans]
MNKDLHLQIVEQFENLELEYNKELQQTVEFAAKLCNTPVACITLMDKNTYWIEVKKGIDIAPNNPLELFFFFSMQTIKHKSLFVVKDALEDARFNTHPLVVDKPGIRFYADAPLITHDGRCVGTIGVIDNKPHLLTTQQKLTLKILAKHAIGIIGIKLSLEKLNKSFDKLKNQEQENNLNNEIRLRSMFESLTDAYFLLGKAGEIIDFNRAAYNLVEDKYGEKLTYGYFLPDYLYSAYKDIFISNYHCALKGEKIQQEWLADYGVKGKVWWDCTFEPVSNNGGEIIGVSFVARNIDERKLNEEKIQEQRQRLQKIAKIQSHDYRGPVTTILGLLNLIEEENYLVTKEYLTMLQVAVKRLDEKILEVVSIVDYPRVT